MNEEKLANGLGWFSIGLGLVELLAPQRMGELTGVGDRSNVLRSTGARELVSGIGILSQPRSPGWVWSRVAGDVMDLGILGAALSGTSDDTQRRRVCGTMAAVAGITALDVFCAVRLTQRRHDPRFQLADNGHQEQSTNGAKSRGRHRPIRKSIIIDRPAAEVYAFWRNLENLPRFMNHLKSVTVQDEKHSHWVAKGPAGTEAQWDAEIIEEKPNELIAWKSLRGATVENAGSVRFEPATGGRGTIVRVKLQYHPPGGAVGATIAKFFGEAPEKQIPVDLLRIKQLLETGEIARTEGQSAGRPRSTSARYDDFIRT